MELKIRCASCHNILVTKPSFVVLEATIIEVVECDKCNAEAETQSDADAEVIDKLTATLNEIRCSAKEAVEVARDQGPGPVEKKDEEKDDKTEQ